MRLFLNDASVQGQFEHVDGFRSWIEELMRARARSPIIAQMRTTQGLPERHVSNAITFRNAVLAWGRHPLRTAVMSWVANQGPFIESDRQAEIDDLFYCREIDVTDGGLGEAARRSKAGEDVASLSIPGGMTDFSGSPLAVLHGFADAPFAEYHIDNYVGVSDLVDGIARVAPLATNWAEMVSQARSRFPHLIVPDSIFLNPMLAREPFDSIIRDRFYVLLQFLNEYMADRRNGQEGDRAKEIVKQTFHGERALFTGESATNREAFSADMTFPDPLDPTRSIFAHWHGKISHRYFRLHFEWPVPAPADQLKILYLGPKITRS